MRALLLACAGLSLVVFGLLNREFARQARRNAIRARIRSRLNRTRLDQISVTGRRMNQAFRGFSQDASAATRRMADKIERLFYGETTHERLMREANAYRKGGLGHVHVVDARDTAKH